MRVRQIVTRVACLRAERTEPDDHARRAPHVLPLVGMTQDLDVGQALADLRDLLDVVFVAMRDQHVRHGRRELLGAVEQLLDTCTAVHEECLRAGRRPPPRGRRRPEGVAAWNEGVAMLEFLTLGEFAVATLMGLAALCAFVWGATSGALSDTEASRRQVLRAEAIDDDGR